MPTKNPRINLTIEPPIFRIIKILAKRDGLSLSAEVKNLMLDAIERLEDIYLAKIAQEREKTFKKEKALTSKQLLSK